MKIGDVFEVIVAAGHEGGPGMSAHLEQPFVVTKENLEVAEDFLKCGFIKPIESVLPEKIAEATAETEQPVTPQAEVVAETEHLIEPPLSQAKRGRK